MPGDRSPERDGDPEAARSSVAPRISSTSPPASDVRVSGAPRGDHYVEHLFSTLVSRPSDERFEASASALLECFSSWFGTVAVGACLVLGKTQTVIRRSPRLAPSVAQDPARLFADFAHERIIELGDGSTLHVAAADEQLLADVTKGAEHLGAALKFLMSRTLTVETIRENQAETEALRLQIIQAEKLASLGQLAAGIVHELNNPLTSILAYSDYLRREWDRKGGAQADAERLRRINEAAERILTFTRDLIAYSRPAVSVPGPVDVREVLDRALLFCEHVITTNSVQVERDFEAVRLVSGVGGQLTQVFVNLVTNGCHAMASTGGVLRIRTSMSEDGEHVLVRVADEGHGIDPANMARLFEPYFTTKTDGLGTGLGLPIVQNIVRSHGGTIHAENWARGAAFVVELPASARLSLLDG
ncbi:MAG: ATP-binding protein [Polyangiaceae bacterium]